MPLPGKSSRTNTHATSVPAIALITTTTADAISVSFSAATACGLLIAFQNESVPLSSDFSTTAASGTSATMLRYDMAMPRPRTAPGMGDVLGPRLTGAAGGGAAATAVLAGLSALPLCLEDLRHDALLRVEEVGVHLVPPAELRDVEQVGRLRELVRAWNGLDDRTVALAHEDLLGLVRIEEVYEAPRDLRVLGLGGGSHRVLDQ